MPAKITSFITPKRLFWLVMAVFVVQASCLALVTRIGTPPDETNHIAFIDFYAKHSLSPVFSHQQPTYSLGDKTREVDYLYHYCMSLLVRALPFSPNVEYKIIRLLSVAFGLLTFLLLARLFRRLGVSWGAITAGLAVLTNLPMVLMMSSAINNDVLVWLGMALGLWLLVRLRERPAATDLAWLIALVLLGGLVKRNLLPVCLLLGLAALWIGLRHYRMFWAELRSPRRQLLLALVVVVIGFGLFAERVGGNIVRYGNITVSCEQVQGEAACYNFWANVRARDLAKRPPETPVAPASFVVRWFNDSIFNIIDIQTQGWRHEVKPARWLPQLLTWLLLLGLLYGLVRDLRSRDQKANWRLFVLLAAVYFMLIQLLVNFSTYRHYRIYGLALNGRYIIPSLLPLALLASFYWSVWLRRYPKLLFVAALLVAAATITGSGLLMMLHNPQLLHG